jgi:hypothetical protein
VGEAFLALGDVGRAQRYAERLRGHAGGRLREGYVASLLGDIFVRLARLDEAARCFGEAIDAAEAIGARSLLVAADIGAAELAAIRGDALARTRHLERAIGLATSLRLGRYLARAARLGTAPELVAGRA